MNGRYNLAHKENSQVPRRHEHWPAWKAPSGAGGGRFSQRPRWMMAADHGAAVFLLDRDNVFAVSLGPIDTDLVARSISDTTALEEQLVHSAPLSRICRLDEVAVWLRSDRNSFTMAASLRVDGGQVLQ